MAVQTLKIVEAKEDRLKGLIEKAAAVNSQITELKKVYDALRREVEYLMPPIPEGEKEVVVTADGAEAKLAYPERVKVNPRKLHHVDAEIFWRLCKVNVTDARVILSGDSFRAVVEDEPRGQPQLTIRSKKNGRD